MTAGDKLQSPVDINVFYLEEKIQLEQRFLYSNYFSSLKKSGKKVDSSLCAYSNISEKPISVSKSELQSLSSRAMGAHTCTFTTKMPKSICTNVSTNVFFTYIVNLKIYYDCQYLGNVAPGVVIALSEETISKMIKDVEVVSDCKIDYYNVDFTSKEISVTVCFDDVDDYGLHYRIDGFVNEFFRRGFKYNWQFSGSYIYNDYETIVIAGAPGASENAETVPGDYIIDNNGIVKKDTTINGKKYVFIDLLKCKAHKINKIDKTIEIVKDVKIGQIQKFPATCFLKGLNVAENMITGKNQDCETEMVLAYAKTLGADANWWELSTQEGCYSFENMNNLLDLTFNADGAQKAELYKMNENISDIHIDNYLNKNCIVLTNICTGYHTKNNADEVDIIETHNVVIFGYASTGGYLVYDTIKGQVIILQASDMLGNYLVVIKDSNINAFNNLAQ